MGKFEFVVSGCLAGLNCRFDGGSMPSPEVQELVSKGVALPVCPERLAGLPVPRLPCEAKEGRIISRDGKDLTDEFIRGAEKAMQITMDSGAIKAILKSKSPSCGYGQIYDGTFTHSLCSGHGIFTKKLLAAGLEIYTEIDLPEALS